MINPLSKKAMRFYSANSDKIQIFRLKNANFKILFKGKLIATDVSADWVDGFLSCLSDLKRMRMINREDDYRKE